MKNATAQELVAEVERLKAENTNKPLSDSDAVNAMASVAAQFGHSIDKDELTQRIAMHSTKRIDYAKLSAEELIKISAHKLRQSGKHTLADLLESRPTASVIVTAPSQTPSQAITSTLELERELLARNQERIELTATIQRLKAEARAEFQRIKSEAAAELQRFKSEAAEKNSKGDKGKSLSLKKNFSRQFMQAEIQRLESELASACGQATAMSQANAKLEKIIADECGNGKTIVALPTQAPSLIPRVEKYIPENGELEDLELALKCNLNALLTGPTGCGKTHLVEYVAMTNKRALMTIQGGAGASFERIVCDKDLSNEGGATVTKFTKGILPQAMESGCLLYLDEPNAIPSEVLFYLFSAMDDRRCITLPSGEVVKAKQGFSVIGAMNEGAGYAGTAKLNAAFRQRGIVIDMHYLPQERESKLLQDRIGIDKETADKLTQAAVAARASVAGKLIKTPIGTRALLMAASLIQQGAKASRAIKNAVINQIDGTQPNERKALSDIFAAHFGVSIS